jgi:hypothetical protein
VDQGIDSLPTKHDHPFQVRLTFKHPNNDDCICAPHQRILQTVLKKFGAQDPAQVQIAQLYRYEQAQPQPPCTAWEADSENLRSVNDKQRWLLPQQFTINILSGCTGIQTYKNTTSGQSNILWW